MDRVFTEELHKPSLLIYLAKSKICLLDCSNMLNILFSRYRDLRKKRDEANKFLKKEIGLDFTSTLILLFYFFGTFILIYCYLFTSLIKLSDFISAFVLWFTAIVVLDYTKETHDLKVNSDRTLREIKQQRQQFERQLIIEQEPYVVALKGVSFDGYGSSGARSNQEYLLLHLKNIGRGPAVRVTVTGSKNDPNEPLFEDIKEPHAIDLGSGDEKLDWKIDQHRLDMLIENQHHIDIINLGVDKPIFFFIFYSDQMGKHYRTRVKLYKSGSGNFLKVMENEIEKQ